ncbi:MAG: dihydroorotase [Prevotella sp.]|nr:dihydroorotase [Prevotella sp.]
MRTLITGGTIVNEGQTFPADIVIEDEQIVSLTPNPSPKVEVGGESVIDATGCYVLPGIIDDHVHFREPGLTEKADMESESRAAAAGGVTSYFDMPNCVPQTTTLEALEDKFSRAAQSSHVNYSFFFGATNSNADLFSRLDPHRIPGIKLFMGSSTGNMLVDRDEALDRIFATAPLPLMAHCEDTAIINRNMAHFKDVLHTDDPDVRLHPLIRSTEACYASTAKAIELAIRHQARLHIAHISTQEELGLIPANCPHSITAEATVGHLYFSLSDYERLGARIKVNPAIKSFNDCQALRDGLNDGRITVVGTDHAPHLLSQKQGGAAKATSGMPMIQFSLVTMLELVDEGVLSLERLVELMAHNPARLFEVRRRGFLRPGYQADIVIVRPNTPWTVGPECIESKCGWSPMEGHTYQWRVEKTLCNGHLIYNNGVVTRDYIGQPIEFR